MESWSHLFILYLRNNLSRELSVYWFFCQPFDKIKFLGSLEVRIHFIMINVVLLVDESNWICVQYFAGRSIIDCIEIRPSFVWLFPTALLGIIRSFWVGIQVTLATDRQQDMDVWQGYIHTYMSQHTFKVIKWHTFFLSKWHSEV